jgi:amino acid transporter
MKRIGLLLIAASFVLSFAPARATLFQYTDSDGVVSYTDNFETIPESSRSTVKKIDESTLPKLLTQPQKADSPEPTKDPGTAASSRWKWAVWTILAAVLLAGFAWLMFRIGGGNVLMKIAGRLMITAALGAGVYLIFAFGGFHSAPSSSSEQSESTPIKRLSPIGQTQETTDAFQEQLNDEKDKLDQAAPDPEAPQSPFRPPIFRP